MSASSDRLSVWPVAQEMAGQQRRGRYTAASTAHPAKMLPALARTAIDRYSRPGELVVDPMCGIGTTLVEAVHLGRRAIGVELEARWAGVAARNLEHARGHGATGAGLVLSGDARALGHHLLRELAASVNLVLTSPPYGPSVHGKVRLRADRVEKLHDRYTDDHRRSNNIATLSAARTDEFSTALVQILRGCRRLLAPHGRLVITARPYRCNGGLIDLPGRLVALAGATDLELEARHVALLAGVRRNRLVPRASFFQLQKQRSGAIPRMLVIAHEDVLVFRRPSARPSR